jgi:hypothetical protein
MGKLDLPGGLSIREKPPKKLLFANFQELGIEGKGDGLCGLFYK